MEATAVTTILEFFENSMIKELTKGMGSGWKLELLKHLDELMDIARSRAAAKNLLEEFENALKGMTGNMNMIRPALLLGMAARLDLHFEDWERAMNTGNTVLTLGDKPFWDFMRSKEVGAPF